MSTPQPPIARRYDVAQTREEISNEIYDAIRNYRNARLDLISEEGHLPVSFRITDTSHEKNGDHFVIGETEEHQTINIHMLKGNGEVFALLAN